MNGIEPGVGAAEVELNEGDVPGTTAIGLGDGRAGRRRCVSGAVPARLGRRAAAGREVDAPASFDAERTRCYVCSAAPAARGSRMSSGSRVEPDAVGATLSEWRGPGDGSPVTFTLAGSEPAVRAAAQALAEDPAVIRYRYTGPGSTRPGRWSSEALARARHASLRRGGRRRAPDRQPGPARVLAAALLAAVLRALAERRLPYLFGAIATGLGVFFVSPLVASVGPRRALGRGPGNSGARVRSTSRPRSSRRRRRTGSEPATLGLAFSAYALLVDHDRLVARGRTRRASALAVALATRLVPSLERDAAGLAEAVRGRGVRSTGPAAMRGCLPLVSGSLERATNLAEAMEARGFGTGAAPELRSRRGRRSTAPPS